MDRSAELFLLDVERTSALLALRPPAPPSGVSVELWCSFVGHVSAGERRLSWATDSMQQALVDAAGAVDWESAIVHRWRVGARESLSRAIKPSPGVLPILLGLGPRRPAVPWWIAGRFDPDAFAVGWLAPDLLEAVRVEVRAGALQRLEASAGVNARGASSARTLKDLEEFLLAPGRAWLLAYEGRS